MIRTAKCRHYRRRHTGPWFAILLIAQAAAMAESASGPTFAMNSPALKLPAGMAAIGDSHGDIAVSPNGDIYVSVEGGERPGIQVYDRDGRYLRNLPNAPNDFHGFVIAAPQGAHPSIYGASVQGERVVQLTLDGELVLSIPATSIPDELKTRKGDRFLLRLTGVAVAANGDIYAVDGYGRDFIHRFDKTGRYKGSFGGNEEPWRFKNCHKIAIDPRFNPERLLCTDRMNDRLIHMDLEGRVLGVFADGLRWPSALTVFQNELAIAELGGRVTILGREGELITSIGANDNSAEIKTNTVPPEQWQPTLFYAPHGITYTKDGDLLVTEWSKWGRVVRLGRINGSSTQ